MKIEKAVEILKDMEWDLANPHFPNNIKAVKLGIEALKAWKQFREGRWMSGRYDLPGETEE